MTILLLPVVLIHWGELDFRCWELPFIELKRCLDFGFVVFIVLMWNMLGGLPLDVPQYVKTYSWSMSWYLGCCGLLDTVVLIAHRPDVQFECELVLLTTNIAFYGFLALRVQRPSQQQPPTFCPAPIDWARLASVSNFFEQVAVAQSLGRVSAFRRISFFAITRWFREPKQRTPIWWRGLRLWDEVTLRVEWFIKTLRE